MPTTNPSQPNQPSQPSLFLLFNHRLTAQQEADARASLGVTRIVSPPSAIQSLWSEVPSEADTLTGYLAPVCAWLAEAAQPGDFALIQGEFGATWQMANQALNLGLIPIYSTTRREAVEEHGEDGRVHLRHTFAHVRFRKYGT